MSRWNQDLTCNGFPAPFFRLYGGRPLGVQHGCGLAATIPEEVPSGDLANARGSLDQSGLLHHYNVCDQGGGLCVSYFVFLIWQVVTAFVLDFQQVGNTLAP